jgi:hypothetical protein
MHPIPATFNISNRIALVKKCKGCNRMLKSKKKYYLLENPIIIKETRWTLVKVCKACKAENYKTSNED